jgi:hypothetical protein
MVASGRVRSNLLPTLATKEIDRWIKNLDTLFVKLRRKGILEKAQAGLYEAAISVPEVGEVTNFISSPCRTDIAGSDLMLPPHLMLHTRIVCLKLEAQKEVIRQSANDQTSRQSTPLTCAKI